LRRPDSRSDDVNRLEKRPGLVETCTASVFEECNRLAREPPPLLTPSSDDLELREQEHGRRAARAIPDLLAELEAGPKVVAGLFMSALSRREHREMMEGPDPAAPLAEGVGPARRLLDELARLFVMPLCSLDEREELERRGVAAAVAGNFANPERLLQELTCLLAASLRLLEDRQLVERSAIATAILECLLLREHSAEQTVRLVTEASPAMPEVAAISMAASIIAG